METEENDMDQSSNDGEAEELTYDESAYVMYHQAQTGAPCLSFDVLNTVTNENSDGPHSMHLICGTQAETSNKNQIIVMHAANLHHIKKKKEEDVEDDDEEDEEEDDIENIPDMETATINHSGGVNRIRCTKITEKYFAASWSDEAKVHIWDLSRPLNAVNDLKAMEMYSLKSESPPPVYTFEGHQVEGFAIDWSPTSEGQLLTGDCSKNIHLWKPQNGGTWHVDQRPFVGHSDSVEDIQWSPNEANVFASCSVDTSLRVWDIRAAPSKACALFITKAHETDINVISWNRNDPFIVSGGDDGQLKIWDLRQFKSEKPIATFKHHTAPITSVEWHPSESTIFAASASDDKLTLWDLSVEKDDSSMEDDEQNLPPQLLFVHQGQSDIKELHWHPRISGTLISTALSGLNIFKTISV